MSQPLDNQVVLSYYDCLLRQSDVNLLKGHCWLNDAVIGFYFEYLERSSELSTSKDIKFASPELTQLLKIMEPADYSAILDNLITESTDYVLFPLNNCKKLDEVGGSHWSLLVYSRDENICAHYDSSGSFNQSIATSFAQKIMKYLGKKSFNFKEIQCPQQNNSYDCGIFVVANAEIILRHLELNSEVLKCNLEVVKSLVITTRLKILQLIDKLSSKE